jgi:hypothetical protein
MKMYSPLAIPDIILSPRPWDPAAGKLVLLPLLSTNTAYPKLPTEIWARVLHFVVVPHDVAHKNLLLVCKAFKVRVV